MKRRIAALLLALVLLCQLAPAVKAEETLDSLLIDACTYDRETDISSLNLQLEDLDSRFRALLAEGRFPWYTTGGYTYYIEYETDRILSFVPENLDPADYDYIRYEQRLAEILDETVHDGMHPWQIALSVHDYLVANCAYDESLSLHTGYDLLLGGSAVCTGYAQAYQALLLRAGVPCVTVRSEAMEHQWNLVQIDGEWYHVDVTWDDPMPNIQGYVSHEYFLLTDGEISSGEKPHYGWTGEWECSNSLFSNGFWRGVKSAVIYTGAEACWLLREGAESQQLICRNSKGETVVLEMETPYIDLGEGTYGYGHFGLSLWDGKLWLNDSTAVYAVNAEDGGSAEVYIHDYTADGRHILGSHVGQDVLYLTLRTHGDDRAESRVQLLPTGYHVHSYTQTVAEPTCTEPGYTAFACGCGISGEGKQTAALGHDYRTVDRKRPSFFTEGYTRTECTRCGEQYTETMPRITVAEWLEGLDSSQIWLLLGAFCLLVWLLLERKDRRRKKAARNRER